MRERSRIGARTGEQESKRERLGLGLKFSLYNLFSLSVLLWFGLKFNKKGDCGLFPQLFAGNQPNKH